MILAFCEDINETLVAMKILKPIFNRPLLSYLSL